MNRDFYYFLFLVIFTTLIVGCSYTDLKENAIDLSQTKSSNYLGDHRRMTMLEEEQSPSKMYYNSDRLFLVLVDDFLQIIQKVKESVQISNEDTK